ncbi:hypothetical protein ABT341_23360, partial [Pseudonocardia alni]
MGGRPAPAGPPPRPVPQSPPPLLTHDDSGVGHFDPVVRPAQAGPRTAVPQRTGPPPARGAAAASGR